MAELCASDVLQKLREHGVNVDGFTISCNGKYLGVYVGRNADEVSWKGPSIKLLKRSCTIRGMNMGITKSICMYNVRAHPVLHYVAQFLEPSKSCRTAERLSVQTILCAP